MLIEHFLVDPFRYVNKSMSFDPCLKAGIDEAERKAIPGINTLVKCYVQ
jgi:hypothetical protein